MKKLLIKLLIFVLIVTTLLSLIIVAPNINYDYYLAAVIDKNKLIEDTPSPRIIFAGGSNLAFGIDSMIIKKATNYNIINMGLHAGLGLRYMLNEVKHNLKKKDIVIIIPEYNNFMGRIFEGTDILFRAFIFYPQIIKYFDFNNYLSIVKYLPNTIQFRFRELLYGKKKLNKNKLLYHRRNFNKYGDLFSHLNTKSYKYLKNNVNVTRNIKKYNKEVIEYLNDFNSFVVNNKKGKVFLMFPPVPKYVISKNDKLGFKVLYKWLEDNLQFPVIGFPEQSIYRKDMFLNTVYHLNKAGREINTKRIVNYLKKILKKSSHEMGIIAD